MPLQQNDNVLAKLDQARFLLSEAKTIQQAKHIADIAEAAKVYAQQANLGRDAVNYATEIRLRAERRLGEMLKDAPKNEGRAGMGRPSLGGSAMEPPKPERAAKAPPTLSEIGLTKKQSSRAQQIASIPEPYFEQTLEQKKEKGEDISLSSVIRESRDAQRMTPTSTQWTEDEEDLKTLLRDGQTIVVSWAAHPRLCQWARQQGLLLPIDRTTEWGNPFILDRDGDRATVIANYRNHYLPYKPSLQRKITALRGKALCCHCAPKPCHGDVLVEALHDSK